MPGRIRLTLGRHQQHAVLDDEDIARRAFGENAVAQQHYFHRPGIDRQLPATVHWPSSAVVFKSQRSQRLSTAVTAATPSLTILASGVDSAFGHQKHGGGVSLGKCVIALRDAARHLQIQALILVRGCARSSPR